MATDPDHSPADSSDPAAASTSGARSPISQPAVDAKERGADACSAVTPRKSGAIADAVDHRTGSKLRSRSELVALLDDLRRAGRRIVFTNGCFDILHAGHVRYLREARQLGDVLVLGVNSDASIRILKGPGRPVNIEADRIEVLSALEMVDHIVLFDTASVHPLVAEVQPDVLVKGGDYARVQDVVGWDIVTARGGEVRVLSALPGRSTTATLRRLQADRDLNA